MNPRPKSRRQLLIGHVSVLFLVGPIAVQAQTWQYTPPNTPVSQSQSPTTPSATSAEAIFHARDPGLREVILTEPQFISGLSDRELQMWASSKAKFEKTDTVKDDGLGPTFNLDSCQGCHAYPQTGGASPPKNPEYTYWSRHIADKHKYPIPSFITADGPTREVRFKKNPDGSTDGGVHDLFTIKGVEGVDAFLNGCKEETSSLPNFDEEARSRNAIFRIPTPTFGLGLIEQIRDIDIIENVGAKTQRLRDTYGVAGKVNLINSGNAITTRVNRNGNDGTVARFGWKAQNKSLLIFSGEAYNVEMGISNELFQTERDETPACQVPPPPVSAGAPNDVTNADSMDLPYGVLSDIEKFAIFMRFLAPPAPSLENPGGAASIKAGSEIFDDIGCAACHTRKLRTSPFSRIAALRDKDVFLFSDLALHNMGEKLEDGISQGNAGPHDFRTAPLWGLGQRIWLLHDGRTKDLIEAIRDHRSAGSEANKVIQNFEALPERQKQNLLNFLRSL
jgi:CxxC motif-containing protein (DUF1111 family)